MRFIPSSKFTRMVGAGALLSNALLAAYLCVIRPWHLHGGATAAEGEQPMAGDELIPDAGLVATRAITIRAPTAAI